MNKIRRFSKRNLMDYFSYATLLYILISPLFLADQAFAAIAAGAVVLTFINLNKIKALKVGEVSVELHEKIEIANDVIDTVTQSIQASEVAINQIREKIDETKDLMEKVEGLEKKLESTRQDLQRQILANPATYALAQGAY